MKPIHRATTASLQQAARNSTFHIRGLCNFLNSEIERTRTPTEGSQRRFHFGPKFVNAETVTYTTEDLVNFISILRHQAVALEWWSHTPEERAKLKLVDPR